MLVKLGVKDTITGFEGVAVARTEWLHGCTRIIVEPQTLHDGKPIEPQWFDEQRIKVLKDGKDSFVRPAEPTAAATTDPGGPQRDPRPEKCPSR